jgi:hypothetical protein
MPWKLEHASAIVYEIFEYMYGVILFHLLIAGEVSPVPIRVFMSQVGLKRSNGCKLRI